MKRLKDILLTASALLCGAYFTACSDDNNTPDFRDKDLRPGMRISTNSLYREKRLCRSTCAGR